VVRDRDDNAAAGADLVTDLTAVDPNGGPDDWLVRSPELRSDRGAGETLRDRADALHSRWDALRLTSAECR
jgi:hypothetical protein